MKLPKIYQADKYESKVYELWEKSGAFQPSQKGEPYSIVMPPPNATGRLHVGHASMLAIEDTLVRYKRMCGSSVLWVPGIDHAGIAPNAIIERELATEGKSKHDIGRQAFLSRLSDFVEASKDTIRSQVKAMGSSTDWTRERYTMEPAMNRIVSEVFIKMYNDGLIYRGMRIVNWDHVLQTTVSDDELNYEDRQGTLYTFRYGPFEISTARPETKFGDKYVVVHPKDKRYKDYKHGDTFEAEWINGQITATVIKDEAANMEFGTGAMTITPWHDLTDFEIAERHKLDIEPIIDLEGKLLPIAGELKGVHVAQARERIVELLDKKGLLVKRDDNYMHRVALSDRGKAVVEPQVMEQWFIDVNKVGVHWQGKKMSLKQVMQSVVNDGDIEIMPSRFNKTYFHWIDNLRDWCISRQIWWGHQIPAWYKTDGEERKIHVGHVPPAKDDGWEQDPDTLDTWFSSALWSWSTLVDPETALDEKLDLEAILEHSPLYKKYHPTSVLETGYDILFFWVARMILMTTYVTGEVPFDKVYLHGLVRTKDGAKMSKSEPSSIIDPLDMISKYGADALRLSMLVGQAPGNDLRLYEDKIASYRNFCNKLWNIARFVEAAVESKPPGDKITPVNQADHWILERLNTTAEVMARQLDRYQLGSSFDALYHFIWDDLADWYVEASKVELNASVLSYVLTTTLKLAHPFTPFITETIWDTLDWESGLLVEADWPKTKPADKRLADEFEDVMAVVKEIRNLRAEMGLSETTLYHKGAAFLEQNAKLLAKLAGINGVSAVSSGRGLHLTQTSHDAWVDIEEQKASDYLERLAKRRDKDEATVAMLKKRLANKAYVRSAPKELVEETRGQLASAEATLDRLQTEVEALKQLLKT